MKSVWHEAGEDRAVTAPLSLIVSAFAPVTDVRLTLTPQLRSDRGETDLLLIDLGQGRNRLGGSALAQVYKQVGSTPPDLDDPAVLRAFFAAVQALNRAGLLLAYHDRSDGGLFACIAEMCFAGHCGVVGLAGWAGGRPGGGAVRGRARRRDPGARAARCRLSWRSWRRTVSGSLVHRLGEPNTLDRVEFLFAGRVRAVRVAHRTAACLVGDHVPHAVTA